MFLRLRPLNREISALLTLILLAAMPVFAQNAAPVPTIQILDPQPAPGSTVVDVQPLIRISLTWQAKPNDIVRSDLSFQPPKLTLILDADDVSPDVKIEPSPLDIFPPIFVATYQPSTSLAKGIHLVEAKAIDAAGSIAKLTWRFMVVPAAEEPIRVEGLHPAQNSFNVTNPILISALVRAEAGILLDSIQLYLNYQPVKPAIVPGNNQDPPTEAKVVYKSDRPLIDGAHAATLSAKDTVGHVAKVEWHFNIDTTPPKVMPIFPQPGSRIPDAQPTIRAEVQEPIAGGLFPRTEYPIPGGSGIRRDSLRMFVDGKQVAAKLQMVPVADAPFELARVEYRPEAPLADGPHKLAVMLKDRAGLKGLAEWTFRVEAGSPPPGNTNAIVIGGVEYRLTLEKRSYLPGEPVPMTFRVTNVGQEEVSFTFQDGQLYDFLVTHQNRIIWRWSEGQIFPEMIIVKKLAPGDQMEFEEAWEPITADGQVAPPGEYQAMGVLTLTREPGPWMDLLRSLMSGAMPIAWPPRVSVNFLIQGEEPPPPPPAGETLAGRVLTQENAPIPGAIAELWLEGRLVRRAKTDEEGRFLLEGVRPMPHTLRVWREGFFPERTEVDPRPKPQPQDETLPPDVALTVQLTAVPLLTPTPYVADFYGRAGLEAFGRGFQPTLPGDVITAQDPDGTVCGVFTLRRPGEYGFLHVVGDDPATDGDEGALDGDALSFQINGEPAQPVPPEAAVWESGAVPRQVDLIISGPEPVEIVLHLRKGDNLIAFSHLIHTLVAAGKLDAHDPHIPMPDLLARWKGVQLVRGFAPEGFRTFDPARQAFSDLHAASPFEGYWLQMMEDLDVTQQVIPLPADTPIPLEAGWNLVPYLPLEPLPAQEALTSIEGQYELVRGFDGGTQLLATGLEEFSDLEQMQPNGAYWIRMTEPGTLVYPAAPAQPEPEPAAAPMASLDASMPELQVVRSMYSNALYGSVTLDGQPAPPGTLITVLDSEGRIAGAGMVRRNGEYGFLHVYRDSAKAGGLSILVNGKLAMTGGKARWTALKDMLGDLKRLDLKAHSRDIGDLNEDGQLDRQDVRLILRKIVRGEKPAWADLTGDGKVTALDAAMLMRWERK